MQAKSAGYGHQRVDQGLHGGAPMLFERSTSLWLALTLGFVGFVLALVGCSNNQLSNNTPPDMAQPRDLTVGPDLSFPDRDPTNHPDLPQVQNFGGPVLDAPEVWTVVWQGDEELGDKVNKFTGWMLQSDFWKDTLAEYGVHAGIAKGVVVLPSAAPSTLDDAAVKTLVKSVIAGLPEPVNANSAISFVVPVSTQQTMQGGQGCVDYGGYHSQTRTVAGGTTSISYLVNLQCTEGSKTLFDLLTEVVSHEVAESATDPFPFSAPGWSNDTVLVGGEIGDLCVGLVTSYQATFSDVDAGTNSAETYVVQRMYSQKVAALGNADPCVPAPATPYFGAALEPMDTTVKVDASSGMGEGVIQILPYAYGDVGDITWTLYGTGMVTGLTVAPKSGVAHAGQTIRVDIQATTQAKGQQLPLVVEAKTQDGTLNEWFGSLTIR
jgi:hypothetical protein